MSDIGKSTFRISADAREFTAVINTAKNQLQGFSKEAVEQYNRMDKAEKRRVDTLLKQAHALGMSREKQILYNASLRGVPTHVLEEVKTKIIDANKASEKFHASINKWAGRLAKVGATAIFGGAIAATTLFIRETQKLEQEQAQLAAVLKSTGNSAGWSQEQINKLAFSMSSLNGKSNFSTGELTEAATKLLSFTNIVGEQVPKALQAAADMSTREGMSIKQAMETVGRAMDIPSQGYTSLSRQGFKFEEGIKQQLQTLERQGKMYEAQQVLLDAMEESYGGAAEAAADTFGGSLKRLQHTVSNLLTGDSGSLSGLQGSVDKVSDKLSDPKMKESIALFVRGLADIANAALDAMQKIKGLVSSFVDFTGSIFIGSDTAVGAFDDHISRAQGQIKRLSTHEWKEWYATKEEADAEIARLQSQIEMWKNDRDSYVVAKKSVEKEIKNATSVTPEKIGADLPYKPPKLSGGNSKGNLARQATEAQRLLQGIGLKQAELNAGLLSDNAKLLASEKELIKFQERIAEIKEKKVITADEKSLLVQEEQIRKALELNVTLEKQLGIKRNQIKLEEEALKSLSDLSAQFVATQEQIANKRSLALQQYGHQLSTYGLGSEKRKRVGEEYDIQKEFDDVLYDFEKKAAIAREKAKAAGMLFDEDAYEEGRQKLIEALEQRLQDHRNYYVEVDKLQSSFSLGFKEGLADYAEESRNTFEQVGKWAQDSLNKTTGTLTEFVTKGKADFRDLANSIIEELARIYVQKSITGLFGDGGGSGILGSIGSALGNVFANAKGGVYSSPSLSSYSNQIVSSPTLFAFAKGGALGVMGEAGSEAIMPLRRGSDGSLGIEAHGAGGGSYVTNISVNVDSSGNTQSQTSGATDAQARMLGKIVDQSVQEGIAKAMRPGGALWQMRNGRIA